MELLSPTSYRRLWKGCGGKGQEETLTSRKKGNVNCLCGKRGNSRCSAALEELSDRGSVQKLMGQGSEFLEVAGKFGLLRGGG